MSEYTKGQYAKFIGYSDAQDDPLLQPEQIIKIEDITDAGITVFDLSGTKGDTVFPEEITTATQEEIDAALGAQPASKAEAPADKPAKGKGGKTKTKAERAAEAIAADNATKAETKAEEPAPSKELTVPNPERGESLDDLEAVKGLLEGDNALVAAKALVDQVDQTYVTLGGVLAHIYATGLHKTLGYDGKRSFGEYTDKELGINYRKAMYLIDIYTQVKKLGIDESRLREIGWSKVKEILRVATDADKFNTLLDYAKEHSRDELISHISTSYTEGNEAAGSNKVKMTTFKFSLAEEAGTNVQAALDEAKNFVGGDDLNACLEHICSEWRQMTSGVEVTLEEAVRTLETRYGVKVSVEQDASSGEQADEQTETAAA